MQGTYQGPSKAQPSLLAPTLGKSHVLRRAPTAPLQSEGQYQPVSRPVGRLMENGAGTGARASGC